MRVSGGCESGHTHTHSLIPSPSPSPHLIRPLLSSPSLSRLSSSSLSRASRSALGESEGGKRYKFQHIYLTDVLDITATTAACRYVLLSTRLLPPTPLPSSPHTLPSPLPPPPPPLTSPPSPSPSSLPPPSSLCLSAPRIAFAPHPSPHARAGPSPRASPCDRGGHDRDNYAFFMIVHAIIHVINLQGSGRRGPHRSTHRLGIPTLKMNMNTSLLHGLHLTSNPSPLLRFVLLPHTLQRRLRRPLSLTGLLLRTPNRHNYITCI